MSITNNFLPFCPTDLGTNLPTQSDYAADSARTNGNQPGIASSKLNNKALRQATYVVGQLAQYTGDLTNTDMLDDDEPVKLLAQFNAALKRLPPVLTVYTSGSGSHNLTFKFFTGSANATAAATYSDGTTTFTVVSTVAAGTEIKMTGAAAPVSSGTLTKLSGTGDATIAFYATRMPLYIHVRAIGGGGGGGSPSGDGGAGGATTFDSLTAGGGSGGGVDGGAGGGASGGDINIPGAQGTGGGNAGNDGGGPGGNTALGGGGGGGRDANAGHAASANSGGGGGGSGSVSSSSRGGGGAGGYVEKTFLSPAGTPYSYGVGAAGSNASNGGPAAAGIIIVSECYQ